MAKMIRLVVAVAAEKFADMIDAIRENGGNAQLAQQIDNDAIGDDMTNDEPETPVSRQIRRINATPASTGSAAGKVPKRVNRTRLTGRVIYTPAGTQRQITAMLDSLRGQQTMRAFVLRDLAKHPESTNKEVRERIAAAAKKAGLSVESVDNVIWQLVNKGQINKASDTSAQ